MTGQIGVIYDHEPSIYRISAISHCHVAPTNTDDLMKVDLPNLDPGVKSLPFRR